MMVYSDRTLARACWALRESQNRIGGGLPVILGHNESAYSFNPIRATISP